MRCAQCGAEKDLGERLPAGWKRTADGVSCASCWRSCFALRAITLPVAGPVCTETPGHKGSRPLAWPEFRERLKASWIATTQASNWMMRQLALVDPGIGEDGKIGKLPGSPATYYYPRVGELWPALTPRSRCSLEQAVKGKYRALRVKLATCQISLPSVRYPVPIPVHHQAWKVWRDDGGRMLLSFPLGEGRITVRLRGGREYRRQIAGLRAIMDGDGVQAELAIYRASVSLSDNRIGDTPTTRVMAKMVAWLPRGERKGDGVAALLTGGDAFLALLNEEKQRIWGWNADHVRRWIMRHDRELQRLREDLKAEKRLGRERDGILARMEMLSRNQNARMHTFCHDVAKQVVNALRRQRIGLVLYTDIDRSYMEHFPWAKLSGLLAEKCARAGIEFASGDAAKESPEPLEEAVTE